MDYRSLNSATKKAAYPMPDSKDIFDRLEGSSIFSTLDCASAYWSIPVREEDKDVQRSYQRGDISNSTGCHSGFVTLKLLTREQ